MNALALPCFVCVWLYTMGNKTASPQTMGYLGAGHCSIEDTQRRSGISCIGFLSNELYWLHCLAAWPPARGGRTWCTKAPPG